MAGQSTTHTQQVRRTSCAPDKPANFKLFATIGSKVGD